MFILDDILTYIRRIIKTPSNVSISDGLLIDYVNRFYINDVDARIQLFDLKKKYSFLTTPGVDRYNMPLYDAQTESPNNDPQSINFYPVYQGFLPPCSINGISVGFQTQKASFFNGYLNNIQNNVALAVGDGGATYTLQVPILPAIAPTNPPYNAIIRGHVDTAGIIATGQNQDPPLGTSFNTTIPVTSVSAAVFITTQAGDGSNLVVTDSGQFLSSNINYGLLMSPGNAPLGNTGLPGGYLVPSAITGITLGTTTVITTSNALQAGQSVEIDGVLGTTELNGNMYTIISATATTITLDVDSTLFTPYISSGTVSSLQNVINYLTGTIQVTFPEGVPVGNNINVQVSLFSGGLPRSILFYNNTLTLRSVPALQYLVELDAYLTPAAFLNTTEGIPYGYMSEYIARGAARKILSDTGDSEQLQFYEPMFQEQEQLVWKRSQRQWTANRTETIYMLGNGHGNGYNNLGGGIYG